MLFKLIFAFLFIVYFCLFTKLAQFKSSDSRYRFNSCFNVDLLSADEECPSKASILELPFGLESSGAVDCSKVTGVWSISVIRSSVS